MGTECFIALDVLPVELLAYQISLISLCCKLTKISLFNIYLMEYWVGYDVISPLIFIFYTVFKVNISGTNPVIGNGKQHFQTFMEFCDTKSPKYSRGENLIIVRENLQLFVSISE